MDKLNLEGTEDTPTIVLDSENNHFEISGRSLPEDSAEFYQPVLDWLNIYAANPNPQTHFTFKMDYFNTASSKLLLDVLSKLEDLNGDGHDVKVLWFYQEDDPDMEDAGEEYQDLIEVPFELKTFSV
ncbi:MAG: nuclear pore complex subunit [Bacteroidetes bacterium]|nr:DUF1987 domain-containing protein [Bacteroidia bacterium]PCH69267.1 MAG: nuclear pore complex subunit [Bacteroidota bacterium]